MSDFWESASSMLSEPLDRGKVKPPPQGKYGEYIDGYHAICEANRIFGHGGWDYTITSLDMVCRTETSDRNGNPQIRVAYKCTVRAQVGTDRARVREGAAVGTGMARPENEGDAHESAVKEAETDALKRALRTFGYTFGLALYDKTQEHVADAAAQARNDEAVALYEDIIVSLGGTDDEALDGFGKHYADQLNRLRKPLNAGGFGRPDLFNKVGEAITKRKAKRDKEKAA